MPNRRLGIITGSGPEAGIDLWTKVLRAQRHALGSDYNGDVDAPNVTVLSVPELGHSMDLPETNNLVWSHLRAAAERLAPQVDRYAIACNTLYFYEANLRELDLSADLISPVGCIRDESLRRGGAQMALLGAAPVTDFDGDTSPYASLRDTIPLELHREPQRVHRLIESIKIAGAATPEIESEFSEIIDGLESDAALLACTELPLVADIETTIELIDVTQLLANALVGEPREERTN